jgi:acyl-CoA synthetase (AMP-forming)/AMP-acid ligase II
VVCVPVNFGWRADEVGYVLGHSRAQGIVIESQLLPSLTEAVATQPGVSDVIVAPGTTGDSASRSDEILRRCIERFGCDFYLLFGQTEMSPTATLFRPEHQLSHVGAVGTPVINVQAAIMDEKGTLLPRGEEGEIVYRGPRPVPIRQI